MAVKTPISIRVDRDVLEYFRQQGPGYQTRMNEALREHINLAEASKLNKIAYDAGLNPIKGDDHG